MTRVNLIKGIGPVLQIAEGWSVDSPEDVNNILINELMLIACNLVCSTLNRERAIHVYSVMANWGANHGVLTIGHVGVDFVLLRVSMLRIPVCMHNVDDDDIYRPFCGLLMEWMQKDKITGPARITDLSIPNNNIQEI